MKKISKLVRDHIPSIISSEGKTPIFYEAGDSEYWGRLVAKLGEETNEFLLTGDIKELIDVLEVIRAICKHRGISFEMLEAHQNTKRAQRGSFDKKIILVRID